MKQILLIVFQLVLASTLFGQEKPNSSDSLLNKNTVHKELFKKSKSADSLKNKHTVYAELFGQGFAGSLNYDLFFNSDKKWKRSLTIGIVVVPKSLGFGDGAYIGVPVSYNWLLGSKRSFLELGIGLTTQAIDDHVHSNHGYGEDSKRPFSSMYTYLTPKLGYRFQPYKSGIFFRATLTPNIALVNTDWFVRNGSLTTRNKFVKSVLNLDYRVFPWFGVSVGYTFK